MDDLVQWLRSQLDEDERIARAASDNATTGDQWDAKLYGDDPESQDAWGQLPFEEDPTPWVCVRHAARHNPAQVLAKVEAKRALLDDLLSDPHVDVEDGFYSCAVVARADRNRFGGPCDCGRDGRLLRRLRLLALPYRAHPDFDPAWLED